MLRMLLSIASILAFCGCRSTHVEGYYETCSLYGGCSSLELKPDSTFVLSFNAPFTGTITNESGKWNRSGEYIVIKHPRGSFISSHWVGGRDSIDNLRINGYRCGSDTFDHYKATRKGLVKFDTVLRVWTVDDTSWIPSKTKWVKIDTNQVRKTCRKRRRNILAKTNHFWLRIRRELVIQRCWKRPRH